MNYITDVVYGNPPWKIFQGIYSPDRIKPVGKVENANTQDRGVEQHYNKDAGQNSPVNERSRDYSGKRLDIIT